MRASDYHASRRQDHDRVTLRQQPAYKGCECHTDTYRDTWDPKSKERRYFRKKYWSTLAGPSDTTEILLPARTTVVFTKLPLEVKKRFGLRSERPVAHVVKRGRKIGFAFGHGYERNWYFPLTTGDGVKFEVRSLPRKRKRAA